MSTWSTHAVKLTERILEHAHELGFDLAGVGPAEPPSLYAHYLRWIEQGYHGEMAYLARQDAMASRTDVGRVLPGIRSILAVGFNYYATSLPAEVRGDPSRGLIASYAWDIDYHEVLGERLRRLAARLVAEVGQPVAWRACTDTCAVLERDVAQGLGLGFIGKNTNLIHAGLGSWIFLGELLITVDLAPGLSFSRQSRSSRAKREEGTCGNCRRCLEACPTGALIAPYVLDARRCISYLTIELKGPIPRELRPLMANHVFGCDVCQEVCPWNRRYARVTQPPAYEPWPDSMAPPLLGLLALDNAGFRQHFGSSAVRRAKRRGLLRNVAVALGNWADPVSVPSLCQALHDAEPLIRGHSAWALGHIADERASSALRAALAAEADPLVRDELCRALAQHEHS